MKSLTSIARCLQPDCGCTRNSFVWISHRHRLIWFEVPKSASSSIKSALHINGIPTAEGCEFENAFLTPLQAALNFPGYFKFAIVRNPWDKMVSLWHMFCQQDDLFRNNQIEQLFGISRGEIDFSRFVNLCTQFDNHHWEKTTNFLPVAEDGKVLLDEIGELNSIATTLRILQKRYASFDFSNKRLNSTDHKHYSLYYDDQTRAQVGNMFLEDIKTFGFMFSPL